MEDTCIEMLNAASFESSWVYDYSPQVLSLNDTRIGNGDRSKFIFDRLLLFTRLMKPL